MSCSRFAAVLLLSLSCVPDGALADDAPPADPAASVDAPLIDAPPAMAAPDPTFSPATLDQLAHDARAWTVRVVASGRVGAGVLVDDGTHVVTLLSTVNIGYPAAIQTGHGHGSLARIVAWDRLHGLALLALEHPAAETPTPPLRTGVPEVGERVVCIGHGGSVGLSIEQAETRALTTWSPLPATVIATTDEPPVEDMTEIGHPDFLIDRTTGVGDDGAPVIDDRGRVIGLVRRAVFEGADRTLVTSPYALQELLAAPRDKKYVRPSHLQSYLGGGLAAHNRPSLVGGFARIGFRVAVVDSLRLEPWFEAGIGSRAGFTAEDATEESRPRDLWWSLDVGLDVGWRIPIPVEGSRDYVVPTAGLRVGWNRFQHGNDELVATCVDTACRWQTQRIIDQEREVRAGIDLGADVQHGRVRFGYRFFVDPTAPAPHSMHRLFVTLDGLPFDIAIGDSR